MAAIKLAELRDLVHTADPSAVLVTPRLLRRLVQDVAKLPILIWQVPHAHGFVVDREVLFRHVEQDELDLPPQKLLPPTVILLAQPSAEQLAAQSRETIIQEYWRRLFHANVHVELDRLRRDGVLTDADSAMRIDKIGAVEFAEATRVLEQDHLLLRPGDASATYLEFVAVFLELRYFGSNLLATYFPGIRDLAAVEALVRQDLDADAIFARTRLGSAPNPVVRIDPRSDESNDFYWRLIRSAERAGKSKNLVRAAILRTKAARVAPAALTAGTRRAAEDHLKQLTHRLQQALDLDDAAVAEWLKVLPALLDKADQGNQPVEAAFLYDLQRVCIDHERTIYALDLIEWGVSGGKRPIMRPLPSQRLVRIVKHLRSAAQRLTGARVSDADREHLAGLLRESQSQSEERLRERLRPILSEAIRDVGLKPDNPPEQTALHKLIEELLDRIIDFGFLTFGDLRDALSRNQLKLPDPSDAHEFVKGDPLLRLDRRLATLLDGVYRPSEFYLRWLERFTALGFGTHTGRVLTRFVAAPFGGAGLVVYGVNLLWQEVQGKYFAEPVFTASRSALLVTTAVLGLVSLALINSRNVRRRAKDALVHTGRALRAVLIEWPTRLAQAKAFRLLFDSWAFQLLYWYLLKPLVVTGLAVWWFDELRNLPGAALVFVATNFVLNSRPGKAVTEIVSQGVMRLIELLHDGLVQGVFRFALHLFKRIVDAVQYVLFTVDELLRYRGGDSKFTMVVRTILGVLWYPISFVARFYMLVLIEPGFNPIKAPVSILAAKIVYPISLPFAGPAIATFEPFLGRIATYAFVYSTWWLLPDAFSFLLWEMKENWRLYRANRQRDLRPVAVGPHGETIRQLLKPGVHSGTIPRLYARLRQAEREATVTGNWRSARVYRRSLLDVQRSVHRLVARELLPLLAPCFDEDHGSCRIGVVDLASNRIRIELLHPRCPNQPARLEWMEQCGWLVASIENPSWLERLEPDERQAAVAGITGLYKLAGVDVIREQLIANLPKPIAAFDMERRDLVLWLDHRSGAAIRYDVEDPSDKLRPRNSDWPVLPAERILFSRVPISWRQWVESWQNGDTSHAPVALARAGVRVIEAKNSELRIRNSE
jgi:hypothetical protein